MSKKPFDFLATEKQAFLFKEKSIIRMDDGLLVSLNGAKGKEIISPASHLVLLLGPGTSITQEAAIYSSFNDMHVAFFRGGCNIHSFFMSGRFSNPQSFVNQVSCVESKKLEIAQLLLHYRLLRNGYSKELIDSIYDQKDIMSLTAWEGRWAKTVYKKFALENKTVFTRDFSGNDIINQKLNVLNNALYSITTAIILACGLHPSIGFIHGFTRRGGLAFDLADIIKNETTLPIAFNPKIIASKHAMYQLADKLRENNEDYIKILIQICLCIADKDIDKLKEFCVSHHH